MEKITLATKRGIPIDLYYNPETLRVSQRMWDKITDDNFDVYQNGLGFTDYKCFSLDSTIIIRKTYPTFLDNGHLNIEDIIWVTKYSVIEDLYEEVNKGHKLLVYTGYMDTAIDPSDGKEFVDGLKSMKFVGLVDPIDKWLNSPIWIKGKYKVVRFLVDGDNTKSPYLDIVYNPLNY